MKRMSFEGLLMKKNTHSAIWGCIGFLCCFMACGGESNDESIEVEQLSQVPNSIRYANIEDAKKKNEKCKKTVIKSGAEFYNAIFGNSCIYKHTRNGYFITTGCKYKPQIIGPDLCYLGCKDRYEKTCRIDNYCKWVQTKTCEEYKAWPYRNQCKRYVHKCVQHEA